MGVDPDSNTLHLQLDDGRRGTVQRRQGKGRRRRRLDDHRKKCPSVGASIPLRRAPPFIDEAGANILATCNMGDYSIRLRKLRHAEFQLFAFEVVLAHNAFNFAPRGYAHVFYRESQLSIGWGTPTADRKSYKCYKSSGTLNDLCFLGQLLIAKTIETLETAAIMHRTEYQAGLDSIIDTKKEPKTSQPKILMTTFWDKIDGKAVNARYPAITSAGGSSNKGLYARECLTTLTSMPPASASIVQR
jgi:hypothetical protein